MFLDLADLRKKPLPDLSPARAAKAGYRRIPIEASPLSRESLHPIAAYGVRGRNYYAQTRNPPYWAKAEGAIEALLVRHSVGERLAAVNLRLAGAGLRLHLFDAWRPRAVQAYFHDVWLPREIGLRRPELTGEALTREVERYWSRPTHDPAGPAPHATGAAVDLTIVWDDGEPLYMGSLFDDATALAHTDRFERAPDEWSFSFDEAQANRRLIYWVMTEAGFASHPEEWWHYSWGDQMWAALTGRSSAHYGLIEPGEAA